MNSPLFLITLALLLNGFIGLTGGLIPSGWLHNHITRVLAAASGVLVATAFIDLIPEAFESLGTLALPLSDAPLYLGLAGAAGFSGFYIIERFIGSHAVGQSGHRHDHIGGLVLLGDALHNIADGVAIAAAFFAEPRLGWITAVTVMVHELPQEIADYTILIAHGWTRGQALVATGLVQLSSFIGAAMVFFGTKQNLLIVPLSMMFSAGGFLYVAAADLIAELFQAPKQARSTSRLLWFLAGVLLIVLLKGLLPHHE